MDETIEFNELILERIVDIGCEMLKAGGEIKRVEETISILCSAYGSTDSDVFTITSSIVVTVRFNDRGSMTQTRRISNQTFDMKRFEFLNNLSRQICSRLMTNEEILEELEKAPESKLKINIMSLIWAVISASFALFFGGNPMDAIFSFVIGAILSIVHKITLRYVKNYYCVLIFCSLVGGILANGLGFYVKSLTPFYINLGNIMLLIPGIALTTAIRDMFSGDTISGLLKFFESMLVALVIAWGFAAFNTTNFISNSSQSVLIEIITAFIGSFGFSLLFANRTKMGLIGALGGMLGWSITILSVKLNMSEYVAFFFSAMFIAFYSEIMAKLNRCPATLFLLVGLIPLVPGKALYLTMVFALEKNWELFLHQGMATIIYAISISAGIIIISLFNARKNVLNKSCIMKK